MANGNGKWPLPEGWSEVRLCDIATLVGGGTPSREVSDYFGGEILWLTPTEIPKTGVSTINDSREKLTELGLKKSSARLVPPGTVLLTSRASIGYVAIAGKELATNQGFASFICEEGIDNFYLAYWLKANRDLLEENATGTTFKEISKSKLREFSIPLAPLPDQHRIVAEIEKQFTRLDAAVAALKRAKANLARYKAAVLKAAVEGRLVPQDPNDEPAAALLARILAERRAQWEAANPKKPYVEPKRPNVEGLGELPVGWVWASWEQLSPRVTVGHVGPMKGEYTESGIPFLRSQNIRENRFEREGLVFISESFHRQLIKSRLRAGDLVVVRSGSVGVTCVIPEELGEANCSDLVIIQRSTALLPLYGAYFMNSAAKRRVREGQVGVALIHFNTKSVAALPVALPPLIEQTRIVEEVERRLSVIQASEQVINANLARAERLRQEVLGKAFRGELV